MSKKTIKKKRISNKTVKRTLSLPYIDEFLLNLQTNNYSDETVYNYERDLQIFEGYLNIIKLPFKKINRKTINAYKAYLNSNERMTANKQDSEQKLASISLNRILSALRSYVRFMIEMDYDSPIAPDVIKLVKTERRHARVAELNDLVRIIEAPSKFEKNIFTEKRNRAMLEILFSTGMRISELINLNTNQIDDTGRIFIVGKGKKERFVYLTPRAYKYLNEYLAIRNDASPALFIPIRGMNANDLKKRISPNYLQERIKRYSEWLKINTPVSAHSLRHGFATYLAEDGANPAAIQILLGHESLNTTTRYVHASDRYAEKTHKDFHPLKDND